eukprot:CAMPEP_0206323798 /NCGR_PEP_ID=MMETSP0106_2-20121207/20174_1 /ASSEMBLY_ACC=CAM_ASM_000206 /TAXON_ID=81532 /ORGANISM="Acanthoeca-like sp., Strain 10tr" /LENGTH=106 /DNA_ID=CAMNT_0053756107 /DNA_START=19 /DNA_END=340 /DNA_ORIENTATION=+
MEIDGLGDEIPPFLILVAVCAALKAFSYKQLLHEPIVGGGLWTALVIPFIRHVGLWPAFAVCASAMCLWFTLVGFTMRGGRHDGSAQPKASSPPGETTPLLDGSEA